MAGADWAVAARLGHGRVQSVLSAGDEGERDGVGGRGRAAAQARRRLSACRWAASSDCPVILPPLDELPEAGRPAGMPMAGRASALCAIGWTVGAATKTQGPRCGPQASSACFHVFRVAVLFALWPSVCLVRPRLSPWRSASHALPRHAKRLLAAETGPVVRVAELKRFMRLPEWFLQTQPMPPFRRPPPHPPTIAARTPLPPAPSTRPLPRRRRRPSAARECVPDWDLLY